MTPAEHGAVVAMLDALLQNREIVPMASPGDAADIQERIVRLANMIEELKDFAVSLAAGDIDAPPPPRSNYIAAGLKQVQAQMLHLTWQTQRVAQGDYKQRIDFMGEFSKAFSEMIEQLRSRETTLREQQMAMEQIFNLIESIFVTSEDHGEVLYANDMATQRFGVRVGRLDSGMPMLGEIIQMKDEETERQFFDERNGKWYGVIVRKLHWGDQNRARLFYCRDITQHKERESTLDIVANTDELTGINNRRAFDHMFAQLWETCRAGGKPLSLIMFDLDYFKRFNDTYGHLQGDRLLTAFAGILRRRIGRADDLVARYGGEEFVAALPFTGEESAMKIAKSVCQMSAEHKFLVDDAAGGQIETCVTASAGVSSIIPRDGVSATKLILAADHALYQSKMDGRNRVSYLSVSDLPQTGL